MQFGRWCLWLVLFVGLLLLFFCRSCLVILLCRLACFVRCWLGCRFFLGVLYSCSILLLGSLFFLGWRGVGRWLMVRSICRSLFLFLWWFGSRAWVGFGVVVGWLCLGGLLWVWLRFLFVFGLLTLFFSPVTVFLSNSFSVRRVYNMSFCGHILIIE